MITNNIQNDSLGEKSQEVKSNRPGAVAPVLPRMF